MESFDFPSMGFYFHKCCACFINNGEHKSYEALRIAIPKLLKESDNGGHKEILNNLLKECESCDYSSPKFAISLKKILLQS